MSYSVNAPSAGPCVLRNARLFLFFSLYGGFIRNRLEEDKFKHNDIMLIINEFNIYLLQRRVQDDNYKPQYQNG